MDRNTYYSLKTIINMRKSYAMNNLKTKPSYQIALSRKQDLIDKVYKIAGKITDKEKAILDDAFDIGAKEHMETEAIYLQGIKDCLLLFTALSNEFI